MQALSSATGKSDAILKQQLKESGDLGIVATRARSTQRTMFKMSALTVPFVFKYELDPGSFGCSEDFLLNPPNASEGADVNKPGKHVSFVHCHT